MFHSDINYELLALIVVIIGLSFTIWKFKIEFNKKNKLESAKFILEINQRFRQPPFNDISYRIGKDIREKESFQIKDEDDKRNLINYLSELEAASQLFVDGVLTETQTYELLGTQILESLQVKAIKDFIIKERQMENQKDFFDQLEKAYEKLKTIQDKKIEKLD